MHFHIITLFPDMFGSYLNESILKRAQDDKKIKFSFYNPRDFTKDKHHRVDQKPYGGGPGMVIEALPVMKAIQKAIGKKKSVKILFMSPGGKQFDNAQATKLAKSFKHIVIISGRYEGIDSRIKKAFKMEEVSVGPYVLTGGELPAMLIVDAVSRQVPGILGNFDSVEENRISSHDVYTRPEVIEFKKKKYKVPKILLSGHHAQIDKWKEGN